MLRADLDLDRAAGRRPSGCCGGLSRGSRRTSAPAVWCWGWSPAARRSSAPTRPSCSPTTRTSHRLARPHGHARRAAHRAHRPTGSRRGADAGDGDRPGALPPARRPGWDADRDAARAGRRRRRAARLGCCGLAGNFGFTAGHGDVSRALAEQVLLPRLRAADARHRRARRRLLLPHPDPRPRQRGTRGHAPRRAPRPTCCQTQRPRSRPTHVPTEGTP